MDLSIDVAGVRWRNPLTVGAGIFVPWEPGWLPALPVEALGALTVKSVSLEPWEGNPPPHLAEVPGGLLNSIGIRNPGVDVFLRDHAPGLARYGLPVVASLAGHAVEEYA